MQNNATDEAADPKNGLIHAAMPFRFESGMHQRIQIPSHAQVEVRLRNPGTQDSNRGRGRSVDRRTAHIPERLSRRHRKIQRRNGHGLENTPNHSRRALYQRHSSDGARHHRQRQSHRKTRIAHKCDYVIIVFTNFAKNRSNENRNNQTLSN